jgi:hypothetical protein
MTQRVRRYRSGALAAFVAGVLLLSGCSGGGSDSADSAGGFPGVEVAPESGVTQDEAAEQRDGDTAASSVDAPALADRSVIYMVDLVIEVDDISAASDSAEAVATRFGGYVQSESTYGIGPDPIPVEPYEGMSDIAPYPPGNEQAVLVLRVPADRYDAAVDELETLGQTVSRNRNAQDVTDEVVDVETRIETQQASIDRLQTLLGEATEISDILAIETELTRRIAELESLKARQEQLAGLTEMATVTVTFVPPETVVQQGTGFVAGLRAGWDALVRTIEIGLTALGASLPFLAAVLIVTVPIVVWLVMRHRRGTRPAPITPAQPEESSASDG